MNQGNEPRDESTVTQQDNLIDAALRARSATESGEGHPSHELLADHAAGELAPEQGEKVQNHLALCGSCSAILTELTAPGPLGTASGESTEEWEAQWETLRVRLQEAGAIPAEAPEASGSSPTDPLTSDAATVLPFAGRSAKQAVSIRRHWLTAAAAALAGLAIGLSLGLFGPAPAPPNRPTSNTQVHTVASAVRGIPPRHETIEVSPDAGKVLILLPTYANRAERYRVEVKDQAGALLWKPWEAKPDALGNVAFELTTAVHPLGSYRVELYPLGSEDPSELVFEIELIAQAAEATAP